MVDQGTTRPMSGLLCQYRGSEEVQLALPTWYQSVPTDTGLPGAKVGG